VKTRTFLLPLCLSALAACATVPASGGARVTGSVAYLQRVALPPGTVIKVQLIDVSRADAPAVVLGEQLIQAEGRQPPFAFSIGYDPSKIQPNWSYAVSARIVDTYRRFIRSGHPLAGYVAPDLQRWQDWSAVPDYAALIRSDARQQPASIYAMAVYLDQAPQTEARAASAALRQRAASR